MYHFSRLYSCNIKSMSFLYVVTKGKSLNNGIKIHILQLKYKKFQSYLGISSTIYEYIF